METNYLEVQMKQTLSSIETYVFVVYRRTFYDKKHRNHVADAFKDGGFLNHPAVINLSMCPSLKRTCITV